MRLKKRRIELHTVTDQLLVIGGVQPARVPYAERAAWGGPVSADESGTPLRLESKEDEATEGRLDVLRDAARSLSRAMKAIREVEISGAPATPDLGRGVDFYDEVRRFEILLIERALWHTGGSQVRAAALLGLKTTTLNSKIKGYNIDGKDLA